MDWTREERCYLPAQGVDGRKKEREERANLWTLTNSLSSSSFFAREGEIEILLS